MTTTPNPSHSLKPIIKLFLGLGFVPCVPHSSLQQLKETVALLSVEELVVALAALAQCVVAFYKQPRKTTLTSRYCYDHLG